MLDIFIRRHQRSLLVYNLELPSKTIPIPNREEVENFAPYNIDELYKIVKNTNDFKYNTTLVMIDFLIRYSAITPEDKQYLEIIQRWRNLTKGKLKYVKAVRQSAGNVPGP